MKRDITYFYVKNNFTHDITIGWKWKIVQLRVKD